MTPELLFEYILSAGLALIVIGWILACLGVFDKD